MLLEFAAVIVISYLVGSIPSGYIAGRALKGIDVRDFGSGASGATNVMRTLGRGPFVAVLLADALKGYIPVLLTWIAFGSHELQVASGIAAVVGHDFPLYIGFRGGRGVATSFGVYAALAMPVSVSLLAVGLFIILTFRYMSLISLVTVPLVHWCCLCSRYSASATITPTRRRCSAPSLQRWCWYGTWGTYAA